MAANFTDVTRKLSIAYEGGTNSAGNVVTKTKTFSNLSETATAEQVQAAGQALGALMDGNVLNIYVKDVNEVLEN